MELTWFGGIKWMMCFHLRAGESGFIQRVERNADNVESWGAKKRNSLDTCSTHEQTDIVFLPLIFGARRFHHLIESSALVSLAIWLKFSWSVTVFIAQLLDAVIWSMVERRASLAFSSSLTFARIWSRLWPHTLTTFRRRRCKSAEVLWWFITEATMEVKDVVRLAPPDPSEERTYWVWRSPSTTNLLIRVGCSWFVKAKIVA